MFPSPNCRGNQLALRWWQHIDESEDMQTDESHPPFPPACLMNVCMIKLSQKRNLLVFFYAISGVLSA